MTLMELRGYVRGRPGATLADMVHHFQADPEIIRGMLAVWIRKGKVERRSASANCGSRCSQCDPASVELYFWNDGAGPPLPPIDLGCRH